MPSAGDFMNKLQEIKDVLDDVHSATAPLDASIDAVKTSVDQVKGAVQQVNTTLSDGFDTLITLGTYTNEALAHNAKQNDTIICILEHISRHTCGIWNEAHMQTALQTIIKDNIVLLADLYAATHAEAALERQKFEALRRQIEECCPPPTPEPVCRYEKCKAPGPLREPPTVEEPIEPPK